MSPSWFRGQCLSLTSMFEIVMSSGAVLEDIITLGERYVVYREWTVANDNQIRIFTLATLK
ncbi:hypothetical protein J2S74_004762 [Evansella vedderi]|uniref:Uncharacterized protein n=1 Tax=Evansella vedderi TaxID=38282 RepID=A0ABU0A2H2_9BACI|nr:hypothetical protein [Evansella vedderi]